jgi:outer membrane protein assembly factor BamD
MILKQLKYLVGLLLILSMGSCSEYQKLLKSDNYELKYTRAIEYYEDGDYYRAENLFEELMNIYKGTNRAEKIHYYYSYCLYAQGELSLAAYHFRKFARTYPNSEHRMDAEFRAAVCFAEVSPKPSLDQAFTRRGIEAFQDFLEKYPDTEYRDTVNQLVDELHHKLEVKAYDNAYLYYKIGEYKSAITALNNSIEDYPDSPYNEDAMFYIVKSSFLLAEGSVQSKMEERYENTISAYYRFKDNYPESDYLQDADKIKEKVETILEQ